MKKKQLKNFLYLAVLLVALQCINQTGETQPSTPIFSGLETINLLRPLNTEQYTEQTHFTYNAPAGVAYMVFGLFDTQIATQNNKISNPANFRFGSRTGMANFSAGVQTRANLYTYNQGNDNFDATAATIPAGTYYWAVWGYDSFGNLTHASPQRSVEMP